MAFHEYGATLKFPRNEHVDIHVRAVTLEPESENPTECIEIREFLKEGEVYGHGLVLPRTTVKDLCLALQRVTPKDTE